MNQKSKQLLKALLHLKHDVLYRELCHLKPRVCFSSRETELFESDHLNCLHLLTYNSNEIAPAPVSKSLVAGDEKQTLNSIYSIVNTSSYI